MTAPPLLRWRPPAIPGPTAPVALTSREAQLLTGMCLGHSNAEIGARLHVTEDTVKTHAKRLFRKLGARDRAHAVALGHAYQPVINRTLPNTHQGAGQ